MAKKAATPKAMTEKMTATPAKAVPKAGKVAKASKMKGAKGKAC